MENFPPRLLSSIQTRLFLFRQTVFMFIFLIVLYKLRITFSSEFTQIIVFIYISVSGLYNNNRNVGIMVGNALYK